MGNHLMFILFQLPALGEIAETIVALGVVTSGVAYLVSIRPDITSMKETLKRYDAHHKDHYDAAKKIGLVLQEVSTTLKERDGFYKEQRVEIGRRIDRLETQSNGKKVA